MKTIEIYFDETVNDDRVQGIRIDCNKKGQYRITDKPHLLFMGHDKGTDKKGNELGHDIFGYIRFRSVEGLDRAAKILGDLSNVIAEESLSIEEEE